MAFPEKLANWVKSETLGFFRDFNENVDSGNPTYLRDGEPESTLGKINLSTGRQICRRWARVTTEIESADNYAYARMCKPYLEAIGEYPGDPGLETPYEGGQCDGVLYTVETSYTNLSGNPVVDSFGCYGPITNFEISLPSATQWSRTTTARLTPTGPLQTFGGGPFGRQSNTAVTGPTITRNDGQPDDCGNVPVRPVPPNPITTPLPPTTVTNPGVSVDIDVQINPDGTVEIIFDPGEDPTTPEPFNPNEPAPDPENDPTLPDEPGDIGEPGSPEETGLGGDTGTVTSDEYLIGIQVDILAVGPRANVRFPGGEPIYFGAGYVFLGTPGNLDLQPEGQSMKDPQFFFAPRGSNSYRVVANKGYNLKVTPFYKPSE